MYTCTYMLGGYGKIFVDCGRHKKVRLGGD